MQNRDGPITTDAVPSVEIHDGPTDVDISKETPPVEKRDAHILLTLYHLLKITMDLVMLTFQKKHHLLFKKPFVISKKVYVKSF